MEESPDGDSLEGQEPQDTESTSKVGGGGGGAGEVGRGGVHNLCFCQNQQCRNKQNAKGQHHHYC